MMFSMDDFRNPPISLGGTPFWAWNCKMTPAMIRKVAEDLKDMGMGGAYLHSRTGMDMPYLGTEFMEMIHEAHMELKSRGMTTCLYDEDRWPSGYGGGFVTRNKEYRSRFLVWSPKELKEGECMEQDVESSARAVFSGDRYLLGVYEIELTDGWLTGYSRIGREEASDLTGRDGRRTWYAYLEVCGANPWFNNQAYVDTLNPKAVQEFIGVAYEAYFRELGDRFGEEIPVIFTDEPQFSFKEQLGYAEEEVCLTIPYTDDFEETYCRQYGESFLEHLPEVFWDLPGNRVSVHRYRYHDHVCQRFTESYADQIGAWCRSHKILLTGHMMREPFLEWQTMALGEAMRSYRAFGIPGIDMLCDRRELTTAKQAQSAVHQFGAPGMTSELYGVTNWDFDFRGHKLAGDWQAALGVTHRVHHLTWTSMGGEAKRDYPASIGSQSPWYKEYSYVENYFARLNTVLRRGEAEVKIGVIHPIESYWLYWGTREHTADIRQEREYNYVNLVKWLLYGLLDFDFIAESLLADFDQQQESGFQAGAMNYDVVLVPDCVTLRKTTVERLKDFHRRKGTVIFAGGLPRYVDAKPDREVEAWAKECINIPYSRQAVCEALAPWRTLDIRDQTGQRSGNLLYQMRKEEDRKWLFVAHSEKPENPDLVQQEILTFRVRGHYQVEKYDPLSGTKETKRTRQAGTDTLWEERSYEHDSFLYSLKENADAKAEEEEAVFQEQTFGAGKQIKIPVSMSYTLSEPNVLLLDRAEYAFDEGPWQEEEDILRIDNRFRKLLGLPLRTEALAQPWVDSGNMAENSHVLHLRFSVMSDCRAEHVFLALEALDHTKIRWNGNVVEPVDQGWYVDQDIRKVSAGTVQKGINQLELAIEFDGKVPVENLYLLGDFGVAAGGRLARITEPAKTLEFGDICRQGLPFFGGSVTYHMDISLETSVSRLNIQASKFRAPVIIGELDNRPIGLVAYSPYVLTTGPLEAGIHHLKLTACGNRVNTFGPVHNCNETETWIGPNAWRTEGTSWSYEYQLKPTGILKAPQIWAEIEGGKR